LNFVNRITEEGVEKGKDYAKYIKSFLVLNYDYYNYNNTEGGQWNKQYTKTIATEDIVFCPSSDAGTVIFSPEMLIKIMDEYLELSYCQASVFFENNEKAAAAAEKLNDAGYIAVTANTTYSPSPLTTIIETFGYLANLIIWAFIILFLAFFINLCSSRTLAAFKGDMAIMRSMGITVNVIKAGMYVRMLLTLIPGYIVLGLISVLIYSSPVMNGYFTYLYAYQYALIVIGMLLLTLMVTHKQIKKLFKESVKKSLKGGNAE
jgi:hypothetical protein